MRILLAGNPGCGLNVLFSRLHGSHVVTSSFPGTNAEYKAGRLSLGDSEADVINGLSIYSLDNSREGGAALGTLEKGDVIINVVNATTLERDLYLTLELQERNVLMLVALNVWDDAQHRGIKIDLDRLSELLGVPVIPTVATTGQGIRELVHSIPRAAAPGLDQRTREERWQAIGDVIGQVQQVTHRHHTFAETLADATVQPFPGTIIALAVAAGVFLFVQQAGEAIYRYLCDPFFKALWLPVVNWVSGLTGQSGLLHDLLIGQLVNGQIDFVESWGLLTTALYVPLAMVLPYIVTFYLALGLLEDTGYLPRLAVMLDNIMHRFGLHGYAIIPTMLGFGCNVPAIMATRALESRKERFIAITLISIAVPCASLQAVILGLVGQHGFQYVALIYGVLLAAWVIIGVVLNRVVKGFTPELLIEIPPYRLMPWRLWLEKFWMRVKEFLVEAVPIMIIAIPVINLLNLLGIFQAFSSFTAPVISGMLGLPPTAIAPIFVAFFRMDAAMALLAPLQMTAKQLVVSSVFLVMFFPCIATFIIILRELGPLNLLKSLAIMIGSAIIAASLVNLLPI